MISVKTATKLIDSTYDCILLVNDVITGLGQNLAQLEQVLAKFLEVHPKLASEISIIPLGAAEKPKTLIFSPCSALNTDYADSRNVYDAALNGMKKVISLGLRNPLLVVGPLNSLPKLAKWETRKFIEITAMLGALYAAYVPLEVREFKSSRGGGSDVTSKLDALRVFHIDEAWIRLAVAMEVGRCVTRDIHGSDPERMAAPNCAQFVQQQFRDDCAIVTVNSEPVDVQKYPLMAAVNRAAQNVSRHNGRLVRLEYKSADFDDAAGHLTQLLVGKGITYDTGGADVKAGGVMAGMSRDKGGAAAVVGYFKVLSLLKPRGINVVGLCAFVRNSIGSESYVADEIITSRAGKRVRVGNTDAEGRMVMADILCEAKEIASSRSNPQIFTLATLTGHVIRCYGTKYSAVMGNGRARQLGIPAHLQASGDLLAEPMEMSTVRREDAAFVRGPSEYEDVLQCNNQPSSGTPRGHQFPAAFMMAASGLDEYGLDSKKPIAYTHLDIAGSSGGLPDVPTATPLLALVNQYILPRI